MAKSKRLKSLVEFKNQIIEDFSFTKLNPNILGVILYGSTVYGKHHVQSDIDICIVSNYDKLVNAYNYIMEHLNSNLEMYDIRFFKELPLTIQGEIVENGVLIISNDEYELYEFLFPIRKQYEDWKFKIKNCI